MLPRNKAICGSLYIDTDGQANFRPWNRKKAKACSSYKKLAHGKVSRDQEKIRFYVNICHDEEVDITSTIQEECSLAQEWLEELTKAR